jgi:hypothetical protein
MYDSAQILGTDGLYTRVGLREPTDAGYSGILDATAKLSKSGNYYDNYHDLASFQNIYDCQNDPDISDANINILIANWQKEAINTALNMVFYDQPNLLQHATLFTRQNVFSHTIENASKFVGFEIEVPTVDRFVSVLNRAILQFDGVATFPLYLFHSSRKEAIGVATEATTVANSYADIAIGKSMYFQSLVGDFKYATGKFYLGYFQDDLGEVKAYDRTWNDSGRKTVYNLLSIRSISATPNGTNMFDVETMEYGSECWGLNLDISSYRDYTNLIMANLSAFDRMQGLAFAVRVLELIKTSGRINYTQKVNSKLPDLAIYELSDQEEPVKRFGLYSKLQNEVTAIQRSLFNDSKIIVGTA